MKRYVLSPLAQRDLAKIYEYISHFNVSAAKRMNGLLRNDFPRWP
jgi:plasmid stabilization system protein ParE